MFDNHPAHCVRKGAPVKQQQQHDSVRRANKTAESKKQNERTSEVQEYLNIECQRHFTRSSVSLCVQLKKRFRWIMTRSCQEVKE